jgi:predicted glycoside hydrolase/deacetylase ChbG (UPF0249 family)
MARPAAAADAIRRARSRPALGIGVHLTLVDGAPMLPPNRVPTLVQDDGRFHVSWRPFIVACLMGRVSMRDVERELTAQIEYATSNGITPTHLDSHKHVHLYPPVFEVVARLADSFRIPVVRVPYERTLTDLPLALWAHQDYRLAASQGLLTPRFVGHAMTGVMTADSLGAALRTLVAGPTELMVHPGYVDDSLRRTSTRLLASREAEVALLTSRAIAQLVTDEHVRLISHGLTSDMSSPRSYRHAS